MNYGARLFTLVFVLLAYAVSLLAQPTKPPAVIIAFAVLSTPVDTKTSNRGDEVLMTTVSDIVVNGKIVVPKGTKLIGHIGGVISKGKEEPKSVIAISIDKAVNDGINVPLQAIIAAIAAPKKALPDDPTYGMMHSNEPKMSGSAVSSASSSGSLPARSKANSSATVATAQLKGAGDEPFVLTEDSQGAYGYEDVSISWHLTLPPPLTIFATKAKRLKLESGTQMLLRMVPPSGR
jgi:hypothetical protein